MISVGAGNISTGGPLTATIENFGGGTIGGSANINFNLTGNLTTQSGDAAFQIRNYDDGSGSGPGTIGGDATVNVTANNISTGGRFLADIFNYFSGINGDGHIGGNATINVAAANITANSVRARINNSNGGTINSAAALSMSIGGNVTSSGPAPFVADIINEFGHIGTSATVDFHAAGSLNVTGDAFFDIDSSSGFIGSDATLNVSANNLSTGQLETIIFNDAGIISGVAAVHGQISGDVVATGDIFFDILNNFQGSGLGTIGSDATITLNAANITTKPGVIPGTGNFNEIIDNHTGGHIVGAASLMLALSGDLTSTTQGAAFQILNFDDGSGGGPGTIGGNATMNLTATNISTFGPLSATIENFGGGAIGGNATINVTAANITANSLLAQIDNNGSGALASNIGGNATINVTAGTIVANSLLAQIDNTSASLNGNAAIEMNVSGSATVTNDATVAISGNDPAGSAAININGSYDVGGTFLSRIDGNGTITFNNASAHADVLKAGVFGTNGVLNVGGGGLSADTTLKLYAPGSNGQLNFMSNVTLGGNSVKILAANSVTIFNNIVVTIGGPNMADVFTNHANYTGFGGNNSTTGTFAGAGAHIPQPLINAPPFGVVSPAPITTRTRIHPRPPSSVATGGKVPVGGTVTSAKKIDNVINVRSSDDLLSLLDDVHPGRDGRIRIPASKSANNSRNSSRVDPAGCLNPVSRSNVDRRAMDLRTASSSVIRRSPQ